MLLYILSKNKLTETFFVHEHFRIRRLFQFISFYSVFNLQMAEQTAQRVLFFDDSLLILP